jgi:RHS repeat-associated protein
MSSYCGNCGPIPRTRRPLARRHVAAKDVEIYTWWGGLVDGMRDGSGQIYMRNRYYDPATGQFTQPDPIGLAGGLNSYGFAAGDPVSYADPYGTCAEESNGGGGETQDSTRTATEREEARLRCIANNYLQPEVRGHALAMLNSQKVGVGDYRLGELDGYGRDGMIFFPGRREYSAIATQNEYILARIFGHELRHSSQSRWVPWTGSPIDQGMHDLREIDAFNFEPRALVRPSPGALGWDGVERCAY